jgi:glutamyl-Q tRNA(Asp) synthetase
MTQNLVTRFAPSPTGRLHLGHVWSAVQAYDLARGANGRFLLRIEDIDQTRCRPEFVTGICDDLRWLRLDWDGDVWVQSQRTTHYGAALASLIDRGLAYRCWCTRAEIAASAGAPQGDEGPVYPGTCKGRAAPDDGRPHCWRLDVAKAMALTGPLHWHDTVAGEVAARPDRQGDVVIARKDAATSYHLAVTVDDAAQGVTDVVRGRDLFAATHIHRLLQALLGLPVPQYHHHALIIGQDGERLAKRRKSPTIQSLRDAGVDPVTLVRDMRRGVFPVGFALEQA